MPRKKKEPQEEARVDFVAIKRALDTAEAQIRIAKHMMFANIYKEKASSISTEEKCCVMGIFDGESMIAKDEKIYPVPPNYASKSKLVAGDEMKLKVGADGKFVFKLIKPVIRKRVLGRLVENEGKYYVTSQGENYQVLAASVSFFKAQVGDKVAITLPKTGETEWAAMDNVVIG